MIPTIYLYNRRILVMPIPLPPPSFVTSNIILNAIFEPKSIAVIGATEKEGSVGRTIL